MIYFYAVCLLAILLGTLFYFLMQRGTAVCLAVAAIQIAPAIDSPRWYFYIYAIGILSLLWYASYRRRRGNPL